MIGRTKMALKILIHKTFDPIQSNPSFFSKISTQSNPMPFNPIHGWIQSTSNSGPDIGLVDRKKVLCVKLSEISFYHAYDPSRCCCHLVALAGWFEVGSDNYFQVCVLLNWLQYWLLCTLRHVVGKECPMCMTLHLSALNLSCHLSDEEHSETRSCCITVLSSTVFTGHQILVSSPNAVRLARTMLIK